MLDKSKFYWGKMFIILPGENVKFDCVVVKLIGGTRPPAGIWGGK